MPGGMTRYVNSLILLMSTRKEIQHMSSSREIFKEIKSYQIEAKMLIWYLPDSGENAHLIEKEL